MQDVEGAKVTGFKLVVFIRLFETKHLPTGLRAKTIREFVVNNFSLIKGFIYKPTVWLWI